VFLEEVKLVEDFILTQPLGSRSISDYPLFPFEATQRDQFGDLLSSSALDPNKTYLQNGLKGGETIYVFIP